MTLQDAIDIVDEMKPNMMSRRLKISFLSEIDQLIHDEIRMKHMHSMAESVRPEYSEDTDPSTELIAPDPYGRDVYIYWLMQKIDDQNQEDGRFNIDRAKFETAYQILHDWWNRTRRPLPIVREIRI